MFPFVSSELTLFERDFGSSLILAFYTRKTKIGVVARGNKLISNGEINLKSLEIT